MKKEIKEKIEDWEKELRELKTGFWELENGIPTEVVGFIEKLLKSEKEKWVERIELKKKNGQIICSTCSNWEVPCCSGCPPCDCHKEGTEEWKNWQRRIAEYERGKVNGYNQAIADLEKLKQEIK